MNTDVATLLTHATLIARRAWERTVESRRRTEETLRKVQEREAKCAQQLAASRSSITDSFRQLQIRFEGAFPSETHPLH